MSTIEVLGVDGSLLVRDMLREALADLPDVDLVDTAPNGKIGLDKVRLLRPDLLLLGVQLGDLPAPRVVAKALAAEPHLGVVLLAHHDAAEADPVVESLEAGALDFVIIPEAGSPEDLHEVMRRRLLPKLRAISTVVLSRLARSLSFSAGGPPSRRALSSEEQRRATVRAERALGGVKARNGSRRFLVAVVGVSTGGPEALSRLVPTLPAGLPLPVVIVLHMPRAFTTSLAAGLDRRSALRVRVARDGDLLAPGTVYLAEGGRHLRLDKGTADRLVLATDDGPPRNGCRPSADILFSSAARAAGKATVAVILTGMGDDGVAGLAEVKAAGGRVLAQDRETSVVWGMPGRAVEAGVVDEVLSLDEVGERLCELTVTP